MSDKANKKEVKKVDYEKENKELKNAIKVLRLNIIALRKTIVQLETQNIVYEEKSII